MAKKSPDTPGRSFLFPFALRDASFTEKVLTDRYVREIIRSSPKQSITMALKGFTDVLSCIRKRLASSNPQVALSDDTILSIIDSICYSVSLIFLWLVKLWANFNQYAWEDLNQVRCHLDGLHVIVKCRGGLSNFSKRTGIQLMILWYVPEYPSKELKN